MKLFIRGLFCQIVGQESLVQLSVVIVRKKDTTSWTLLAILRLHHLVITFLLQSAGLLIKVTLMLVSEGFIIANSKIQQVNKHTKNHKHAHTQKKKKRKKKKKKRKRKIKKKKKKQLAIESPVSGSLFKAPTNITFVWSAVTFAEPACQSQMTSFQYVFILYETSTSTVIVNQTVKKKKKTKKQKKQKKTKTNLKQNNRQLPHNMFTFQRT